MNQEQVNQEQEQSSIAPEIKGKVNLKLHLSDQDTDNQTTVAINLYSNEDKLEIVRQATQATLRALIAMGYIDKKDVELDTRVHTITYGVRQ